MKKYEVWITTRASNRIEETCTYIKEKLCAPIAAAKLLELIEKAVLSLVYFPERYPRLNGGPEYFKEIRQMPVGNYLVFYIVGTDRVTVIDVLYNSSDVRKRIQQEFLQ